MRGKTVRVKLHFFIRRIKAARRAYLRSWHISGTARVAERDASAARFELIQCHAGGRQLIFISRFDIAIPERDRKPSRFANSKMIQVSERRSANGATTADDIAHEVFPALDV